jgi:hypothetical protein
MTTLRGCYRITGLCLAMCACADDAPPAEAKADPCVAIRTEYNRKVALRDSLNPAGASGIADFAIAEYVNQHWACFH